MGLEPKDNRDMMDTCYPPISERIKTLWRFGAGKGSRKVCPASLSEEKQRPKVIKCLIESYSLVSVEAWIGI